jgi:hypothetical protein
MYIPLAGEDGTKAYRSWKRGNGERMGTDSAIGRGGKKMPRVPSVPDTRERLLPRIVRRPARGQSKFSTWLLLAESHEFPRRGWSYQGQAPLQPVIGLIVVSGVAMRGQNVPYCMLPATSENGKVQRFKISSHESTLRLSRITVCKEMPSADLLAICVNPPSKALTEMRATIQTHCRTLMV